MTKLVTAALALALTVTAAGCSQAADPAGTTGSTGTTGFTGSTGATGSGGAGATSGASVPSDTMSSGTVPDDGSTAGASATAAPVDQSTPEKAMSSWLGAMVAGDGETVCALMAAKGKAIPSIPGAAKACGTSIAPTLEQITQLGAVFTGLTIDGATVTGDAATFERATAVPPIAATVVKNFKAVRIGGKWYVTQG